MGGRGKSSGSSLQITLEHELKKQQIHKIIVLSQEKAEGTEGGFVSPQLYKRCACCSNYILLIDSKGEVCSVYGWIDDNYQNLHPQSASGPNPICLEEFKRQYFQKKGEKD